MLTEIIRGGKHVWKSIDGQIDASFTQELLLKGETEYVLDDFKKWVFSYTIFSCLVPIPNLRTSITI
jgi:hypothetical protein